MILRSVEVHLKSPINNYERRDVVVVASVEVHLKSPINNYMEFYTLNEAIEYAWFMCRDIFKHMILVGNRGERVKFDREHIEKYLMVRELNK